MACGDCARGLYATSRRQRQRDRDRDKRVDREPRVDETRREQTQARLASFQRQLSLYQFRRAKAAPGAPAPPMAYAHPRFMRDADAAALQSVTRAASPKSSPPSSPKAAAPGSAEAPTSPRVRPREANEESALTALFALSGVSSGGGGDAAPVEPKRQKVDEPVRVVG